jgi:hypothetical protein
LKSLKVVKFLFLLTLCTQLSAQKWEYGAGVGLMHYKGDISPRFRPLDGRPGANIFVRYNKDRAISYRGSINAGRIVGDETNSRDRFQRLRGFAFKTNLLEINGRVEYNFHNFRVSQARNVSNWTPYTYLGFGGMYRQLTDFQAKVPTNPVPETVQFGKKFLLEIPFGVGFKKKWKGPWNYGAEFGTNKLLSLSFANRGKSFFKYDYLDGLGSEVVDINNRLQTANKDLGDWNFYANFYISYVFYKVACPKD